MDYRNEIRKLILLLQERSFERKEVTLTSGRKSDFFIDCKQTVLTAQGHNLIGEIIYHKIVDTFPCCEAVAGVELGGCPIASAVSLISNLDHNAQFYTKNLPALYIRKNQKDHGSKRLIEGDRSIHAGMKVIILEDVITTGGSTLAAVKILKEAGLNVIGIITIVDRLEGGTEALKEAGFDFNFIALTSRYDFIPKIN
jgi:orotate phosphoribosyltransferase